MLSKLTRLLLFVLALQAGAQNKNYTLLWKIEGPDLKGSSYLFGTMHVSDARAFNFSDSVMVALNNCRSFAMEIHPDTLMSDVFNKIGGNLKDNKDLRDLLPEEDYRKLDEIFREEHGYSIDKLHIKNPFFIRSMLSSRRKKASDKATFVDAWLLGIARTLQKKIYGLEKTEDQISFFNSFTKEELRKEFEDFLNPAPLNGRSHLDELTEVYASGDITRIEEEVQRYGMSDSALNKRNLVMLNSMLQIMRKEKLFTAVGAAHLPGSHGLIELLKAQGYKVTAMPATFTHIADRYTIDPMKMDWHTYRDTVNGLSVQSPGPMFNLEIMSGLDSRMSFDLSSMSYFGFYVLNMSHSTEGLDEEKVIGNIVNNYRENDKYTLSKVKRLNHNGQALRELQLKMGDNGYMRLQLFVRNNVLYGLFAGGSNPALLTGPVATRYFNSCAVVAPAVQKDPTWLSFSPSQSACSIALPFEPQDLSREINDGEGHTYNLRMFMSTDMPRMTNYLVRYNDFPEQTYLQNKSAVFESMIAEMLSQGSIVGKVDTVWKDGFEGRRMTYLIKDKYFSEIRMYARGNRVYMLLKQALTDGARRLRNDVFFESFTLEPFKAAEPYQLDAGNFEVLLPSRPKVVKDSAEKQTGYTRNTVDYYATNPESGGLYFFEHSELGKFFRIKDLSTHYKAAGERLITYEDSLISSDSVIVDGRYARELVISRKNGDNLRRLRVWITDGHLFFMMTYLGKDELFTEENNRYFNSFRMKKKNNAFDMFASKADQIMEGLRSKDSAYRASALEAFDYYTFDKTELKQLLNALAASYPDDSLYNGTKRKLIESIEELKDPAAIPILAKEFYSSLNKDHIKAAAVVAIANIQPGSGTDEYLKLLRGSRALTDQVYHWTLFAPLRDSAELTRARFDQVLTLLDTGAYRDGVVFLSASLLKSDSTGIFRKNNFDRIFKYAYSDLDLFVRSMKDSTIGDIYGSIYSYLSLLEDKSADRVSVDKYSATVLAKPEVNEYLKATAMATRIIHRLPCDKKLLGKLLADLNTRYTILESYETAGDWAGADPKYTSAEELGRLVLYNYISEDAVPEKIKTCGKVQTEEGIYYAYVFTVEGEKGEFLGASGPFAENGINVLSKVTTNTLFAEKQSDWKQQTLDLVK